MSPGRRGRLLLVAVLLTIALPLTLPAASSRALRRGRRLLERLKLVDGAGSGLDADTLRGLAPHEVGLVVRDAGGALVGIVIDPGVPLQIVRPYDGRYMVFPVGVDGFLSTCPFLCYENANCTGAPYRDALDALLPFVSVCGTTGHYPTGAATSRAISSCEVVGDPQCIPQDGSAITVTAVATFDITSLGLTPPFHVDGP